jgi:hypothetical protein
VFSFQRSCVQSSISLLVTDLGRGMLKALPLGSYLLVADYTGRLLRVRKAAISSEVFGILHRIGISLDEWRARLERLRGGRLLGRFLASGRKRLQEVAARLRAPFGQPGCVPSTLERILVLGH